MSQTRRRRNARIRARRAAKVIRLWVSEKFVALLEKELQFQKLEAE